MIFGSTCTSPGEAPGRIATESLPFELATIKRGAETKIPGVLVTPNAATGRFATFTCAGGFSHNEVKGNGVIGRIESPKCGEESATTSIIFETLGHGIQKYTTLEGTETEYDLNNNGTTFAPEETWTITFPSQRKLVCT